MNKQMNKLAENKPDILKEPEIAYVRTFKEKLDPANTDEQEIVLRKLLEIGLKQSEMGLGISNEEMKRRTKLKYPFLK